LNTFLNAFIMDIFIERIHKDLDKKIDQALMGTDVWTALSNVHGHNMVGVLFEARFFGGYSTSVY
jgi:hypothetical protein